MNRKGRYERKEHAKRAFQSQPNVSFAAFATSAVQNGARVLAQKSQMT
jgi:hypothetical protein